MFTTSNNNTILAAYYNVEDGSDLQKHLQNESPKIVTFPDSLIPRLYFIKSTQRGQWYSQLEVAIDQEIRAAQKEAPYFSDIIDHILFGYGGTVIYQFIGTGTFCPSLKGVHSDPTHPLHKVL